METEIRTGAEPNPELAATGRRVRVSVSTARACSLGVLPGFCGCCLLCPPTKPHRLLKSRIHHTINPDPALWVAIIVTTNPENTSVLEA